MQSLINIFQRTKEILCKYDYYIYTSKRVLHISNSESKIPHLMGMQYIGELNQFTGDYGVYLIKKGRSELYLYEKAEETAFTCDYLMVHESEKVILHLGLVKSANNKGVFHCNSFMATYQTDREKNLFFRDLSHRYEINKIMKFGKYHLVHELRDVTTMLAKCENKQEEMLVRSVSKALL